MKNPYLNVIQLSGKHLFLIKMDKLMRNLVFNVQILDL